MLSGIHQQQFVQIQTAELEDINSIEDITNICINHLRVKGAEAISEARLRANLDRFEMAQEILNNFISELNNSPYSQSFLLNSLKQDLQKALNLCHKQEFQAEGQVFMIKKERNLLKRTGSISSGLGWTEGQQEIMQEFKEGKLALSDDSCPSRFGDDKIDQDFNQFEDIKMQFEVQGFEIEKQKMQNEGLEAIDQEQNQAKDLNKNNDQETQNENSKNTEVKNQDMIEELIEQKKCDGEDNSKFSELQNKYEGNQIDFDYNDEEEDNYGNHNEDCDEEEEEMVVLSSLAQKLMEKNANIDKVLNKKIEKEYIISRNNFLYLTLSIRLFQKK